jgi:hypothetical protein
MRHPNQHANQEGCPPPLRHTLKILYSIQTPQVLKPHDCTRVTFNNARPTSAR